ncbi:4077_t:CDS:1 [Dentiscutata erythropus]|uniref:4077_t:CDS:1 n=1 Tax=Dentiscutata erythropus TaxID=1348616 RepID=A0A9N9F2T8_9GLOM|nr:4077_t:CDS:1 [Dentiscutata erythropus]
MYTRKSVSFISIALGLILIGFILSTSASPLPGRKLSKAQLLKRYYDDDDCDDDYPYGGYGGRYGGGYYGGRPYHHLHENNFDKDDDYTHAHHHLNRFNKDRDDGYRY